MEAARRDLQRLKDLQVALNTAKNDYWAKQTEIQIKAIESWVAMAEHRPGDALLLARAAADAESASDKHPVTPGNVVPCRELLGDLLIELGQPKPATEEFERSLRRDPNRFGGIYGAARAAAASGNTQARVYYAKLVDLTAHRDTDRPEIIEATEYLKKDNFNNIN